MDIRQAKNGKLYIEAGANDYAVGDTIKISEMVVYEETPGLSPRKREKMKDSGQLAVIGRKQHLFVVTGVGEEYATGDVFDRVWKRRFYGEDKITECE